MSFKRPIIKALPIVSQILPSTGDTGRVGEIIIKIQNGDTAGISSVNTWRAPYAYNYSSKFMPDQDEFIKKCEDWLSKNYKPPPVVKRSPPTEYDTTSILALYKRYPYNRPPVRELVGAMRSSGFPSTRIDKTISWYKHMNDTEAARQKTVDDIFIKYPSVNKPTPKPRKVINAVKKKMSREL